MHYNLEAPSGGAQNPLWNMKWCSARNQCHFVNCFSVLSRFPLFGQVRRRWASPVPKDTKRKCLLMVSYKDVASKFWTRR